MTNEQREAIEYLERQIRVCNENAEICDNNNFDEEATHLREESYMLHTVLSLIKGSQTEIEIYKEELDSIYKALDIERGVARPRTYEIIQALKNAIKCQAKQIDLMAEYISKQDIEEDICIKNRINADLCNENYTNCKECIKQYFAGLVEKE